ncbi:MAG: signal recognition particle protein [Alphaproteobacteria bacterium]
MFQSLSEKLTNVLKGLGRQGALTEQDVTTALREIRIALLEADVALPVVKNFIEKVKEKAIGQKVVESVSPAHLVTKIVHDELVEVLGSETTELNLATTPPAIIMMVGLQGSGKTTSSAKLAKYIKDKLKKKVLMASLDVYRPAAQEQLEVLAHTIDGHSLPIIKGQGPLDIAERALKAARLEAYDVLILDTAGRLHIDEALMDELVQVKRHVKPIETLLVVDAMTGQDAANIGKAFQDQLSLTGIILTRLDGDARGGAALSIRQVTGCSIKFMGVGEKVDALEVFHPDRVAGRILDQGDIVSLVEKAIETIDKDESERLNRKIEKGSFDLNDMAAQLQQMMKMGGMSGFLNMLPGMGGLKEKMASQQVDDRILKKQIAIIQSMTPKERRFYKVLNGSRRRRIALGSGTTVQEVNRLLKQFEGTLQMMKRVQKMSKKGFLQSGLKNLFN